MRGIVRVRSENERNSEGEGEIKVDNNAKLQL